MNERPLRPIGIDLFAGAGGMSLGFEQAGFDLAAAVEIDPIHAAAHEFNFPSCSTIARSVTELTGAKIRKLAGLGDRKVDVVFGGAPCQGFSLIGQRAFDDPRNCLVRDFVRLVKELDADYFVFENVKGLTVGDHKQFLSEIVAEFEALDYQVRLPWRVLNANRYGVPQHRERLFLLGAKSGLAVPDYPDEISVPAGAGEGPFAKGFGPSCFDALADLPDAELFAELNETDEVASKGPAKAKGLSAYAAELRCENPEHWHFGHRREWDRRLLTSSRRTRHSEISRRRFHETTPGDTEPISRFYKLPEDGISNTLRAGTDAARGAFTSPRPVHYRHDRCVTVREMARLHGFPDWFRFHRTKWHGARQIGNSVPPPLARAVAGAVIRACGFTPERSKKIFQLGDPALLGMDMKQAAKLWGIDVPIGKRDQKSGRKKRKQEDIEKLRLAGIES